MAGSPEVNTRAGIKEYACKFPNAVRMLAITCAATRRQSTANSMVKVKGGSYSFNFFNFLI